MKRSRRNDVHVVPVERVEDIEHDPGDGLFCTGYFDDECWACREGMCTQRIEHRDPLTGSRVIVHGLLRH